MQTQQIKNIVTPEQYIRIIHGRSDNYINHQHWTYEGKEKKVHDYRYKMEDFIKEVLPTIIGNYDHFITLNQCFYEFNRKKGNITSMCNLYADIDFYKKGYNINEILLKLRKEYYGKIIPHPTFEISSGRGLYLQWCIETVYKPVRFLWLDTQEYIVDKLHSIGIDAGSTKDLTRVLRIPGSVHRKTNNTVTILSYNDVVYDINKIQDKYLPSKKPFRKNKKGYKNKKHEPTDIKIFRMFHKWIEDIETICEMRNYDVFGYRDWILYYYINAHMHCLSERSNDIDNILNTALEYALALNDKFVEPFKHDEVITILKPSQQVFKKDFKNPYDNRNRFKGYQINHKKVIYNLHITKEEQKKLKAFISKEIRYDRKNNKRKQDRRNSNGKTKRQQKKEDNINHIIEIVTQHPDMSQTEIGNIVGISRSMVSKYLKEINDKKLKYIGVNETGRYIGG